MTPIIDFYDAVAYVPVPTESQQDTMLKVAAISRALSGSDIAASREDADKPLHDFSFAMCFHTKHGQERRFRIDSPEQTALSASAFSLFDFGPEEARKVAGAHILRACDQFGIEYGEKLAAFKDDTITTNATPEPFELPQIEKIAQADFALPAEGRYPLRDPKEVADAAAYFDKYSHYLVPQDRFIFARNVMTKAAQYNMPPAAIPKSVHTHGSYEVSPSWSHGMRLRKEAAQTPQYQEAIEKLEKLATGLSGDLFVHTLENVDKAFGHDKYAELGIPDPWTTVYWNPSPKIEEDIPNRDILEKVASGKMLDIFPAEIIAQAVKDPDSLDPLTRTAILSV